MKYRIYRAKNPGYQRAFLSGNKIGLPAETVIEDNDIQLTPAMYYQIEFGQMPSAPGAMAALMDPAISNKIQTGDILILKGYEIGGAWLVNRHTKTTHSLEELPQFYEAVMGQALKGRPQVQTVSTTNTIQRREKSGKPATAADTKKKTEAAAQRLEEPKDAVKFFNLKLEEIRKAGKPRDIFLTNSYGLYKATITEVHYNWIVVKTGQHESIIAQSAIACITEPHKNGGKQDD